MTEYIFDGSLEGLLTSVFEYYDRGRPAAVKLIPEQHYQATVFGDSLHVQQDAAKASRVWSGLSRKLAHAWMHRILSVSLSEQPDSYQHLFDFICYIIDSDRGAEANFSHPAVLSVVQTDRKVQRERHRMEAFIRFEKIDDGIFYARVAPDFNVLPLLIPHFRNRYADQSWIIYDEKRRYGIYYDLEQVQEINPHFPAVADSAPAGYSAPVEEEALYTRLWKDYFSATTIAARKNAKLHVQHVPRRYWRFLTEKQP